MKYGFTVFFGGEDYFMETAQKVKSMKLAEEMANRILKHRGWTTEVERKAYYVNKVYEGMYRAIYEVCHNEAINKDFVKVNGISIQSSCCAPINEIVTL